MTDAELDQFADAFEHPNGRLRVEFCEKNARIVLSENAVIELLYSDPISGCDIPRQPACNR